jgi:hypothetical protein
MPLGQVAPEAEETIGFGLKSSNGLYIDGGNNKHKFFCLVVVKKTKVFQQGSDIT